jgi:phosphoribosylaminoimidazolecarboxamide formyltransferase/IMP cyclohydrolase
MSSFGDFAALSDPVDEATAQVFKSEVSDGVIAPGYEPAALEILKSKKGGNYIVLQADPDFQPPEVEYKEVFGVAFSQQRNVVLIGPEHLEKRVTQNKALSPAAERDLIVASIAVKYTQSNSVGYALDGQMIGVGAGQQSRVDCTKLAGRKVDTWFMRQHSKVRELPFKAGVRRVERVNAQVRYIEGDFTPNELREWQRLFDPVPAPLTEEEKREWMGGLKGVSLASDAFFPFRDSIDQAAQRGVEYIVQPGGSIADEAVVQACDEYGMVMAFSGVRLFHH